MSIRYYWKKSTKRWVKTKIYECYCNARQRCHNPNDKNYKDYGGRGIQVISTFQEVFDAVGHKPSPEFTFGRIDNDGHYSADNVEWQTRKTQANNRRVRPIRLADKCVHTSRKHCSRGMCRSCYTESLRDAGYYTSERYKRYRKNARDRAKSPGVH